MIDDDEVERVLAQDNAIAKEMHQLRLAKVRRFIGSLEKFIIAKVAEIDSNNIADNVRMIDVVKEFEESLMEIVS